MESNTLGSKELNIFLEQPRGDFIGVKMEVTKDEHIIAYFYLKEKGWVCVEYQRWVYKEGRANRLFHQPIVCENKEDIIPAFKKEYARIILQKTEEAKKAHDALVELHKLLTE